jgi:hypothetical protein
MRPALSHEDATDARAADRTGLARALVDPEVILKLTAPIHPVDARPVVSQPATKRRADPPPKPADLLIAEPVAAPERVEAGPVQRLIGIDVAETGDKSLIEQEGLESPRPGPQPPGKDRRGETSL